MSSHQERTVQRTAVFPQATSYRPRAGSKTPSPALPEGEGDLSDASRSRGRPVAVTTHHVLRTTYHELRTTNYVPPTHRADTPVRPYGR